MTVLDNPIWAALATRHAHLAEGDRRARRYPAGISPFAAIPETSPETLAALAALAKPGETLMLIQADAIAVPPGLDLAVAGDCVQMVADTPLPEIDDPRIGPLGILDVADMVALATLSKPGPFSLRALELGRFWGIRIDGRLAAMGGERLRQPDFAEISGVCVHPDFRRRGLGALMSRAVAGRIAAAGETAYLHAYADNAAAIDLYAAIGFRLRRTMRVAALARPA